MYFQGKGCASSKKTAQEAWALMKAIFALGPDGRGDLPQYCISRDKNIAPKVGLKMEALNTQGPPHQFKLIQYSDNDKSFEIEVIDGQNYSLRKYRVRVRQIGGNVEVELTIKQRVARFPYFLLQLIFAPFAKQMLVDPILKNAPL